MSLKISKLKSTAKVYYKKVSFLLLCRLSTPPLPFTPEVSYSICQYCGSFSVIMIQLSSKVMFTHVRNAHKTRLCKRNLTLTIKLQQNLHNCHTPFHYMRDTSRTCVGHVWSACRMRLHRTCKYYLEAELYCNCQAYAFSDHCQHCSTAERVSGKTEQLPFKKFESIRKILCRIS